MIRVAITTYNRPDMLRNLIDALHSEGEPIDIYVYDDGSNMSLSVDGCTIYTFEHGGKQGFYRIINTIIADARDDASWRYLVVLPDDVEPVSGFLGKAIRLWESIEDSRKAALGVLLDEQRRGKACWTGYEPQVVETDAGPVYHTQWTEHALIAGRVFADIIPAMHEKSHMVWQRNPRRSSGSGAHISQSIVRAGYNIYQVYETLVHHGDHESLMNPLNRDDEPLTTR